MFSYSVLQSLITLFLSVITAILVLFLGIFVFLNDRKKNVNKVFLLMDISIVLWILSVGLRFNTDNPVLILAGARLSYATAAIVGFLINYFCYSFPQKNNYRFPIFLGVLLTILIVLLSYPGSYIIKDIKLINGVQENVFGPLFFIFALFFPLNVGWGIYNLLTKKSFLDQVSKTGVNFILTGVVLSTATGFSTNLIIPILFGTSVTEKYGPLSPLFFIILTTYAILKHHLFDVRVIATELLTFAIWFILLIKTFLSGTIQDLVLNVVILISVVFFGILLIRSVLKEVEQREQIEKMAKELERAYEGEKRVNEELKNLDKVKNQFLAQTQHDLRTPLTSIRGYCELMLGGAYGKQNKEIIGVIKRVQSIAENKIKDVNNFLDATQFQLGKKVVSLKPGVGLNPILDEIIDELSPNAEAKGIYLKLERPLASVPPRRDFGEARETALVVSADREKLRAALFNIIDNCVKYTEKGGVTIKIFNSQFSISNQAPISNSQNSKPVVTIVIKDTGIGMSKERIEKLFDAAFERGERAKKVYTGGMGIGLFLSSQIIKAHNGRIWAESEGEGKGSTFYVELPVS